MSRSRNSREDFRRKKQADEAEPISPDLESTESDEEAPSIEPGQMAQLIVDMRNGMVDRQAAGAIAGPLTELAQAFAMQAEILRGVTETQKNLEQAIKDDKKSEMVVNSTKALNDTFRGVRSVQQKLLDELEDRGQSAGKSRVWTYAFALIFVAACVGGFVWFNDRFESRDSKVDEKLQAMQAEVVPGLQERAERAEAEADAAREDLTEVRNRLETLQSELATLRGEKAAEVAKATSLEGKQSGWEAERARLEKAVEDLRAQVTFQLERSERAEREVARLQEDVIAKLSAANVDRLLPDEKENANIETPIVPDDIAAMAKAAAATDTKPAAEEAAEEKPAEKKPAVSASAVVEDVNLLLSNHRGSQVFKLESVGEVTFDDLRDIVFTESAPGEGVVKRVRAERLEVVISGRGDLVEFNFKKGAVQQKRPGAGMGDWAPFYNDRYRMTVYCLNGKQWLARSYPFFYVD